MGYLQDFDTIGERKDRLKLIIAEIEMRVINDEYFNENDIDFYGNIIDVMPIIKAYLNYLESFPTNIESEGLELNGNTPINIDAQEKFIYCYELGIIEHLREFLKNKNQKATGSKIYPLLSSITGVNPSTIKRLMTFANNPINANEGNPFKNEKLMERVNTFLYNNGLKE